MPEAVDPVTSALTGHLPFYLLVAAAVTWPISRALLRLYTRAVRRSMRSSIGGGTSAAAPAPAPPAALSGSATLYDLPESGGNAVAEQLVARLLSRPWQVASVYAVAGIAYALVMASAHLLADGLEFFLFRFLFLFWTSAWPIVLTTGIVAATTRRAKLAVSLGYFVVLVAISAAAMRNSPDASWGQAVLAWAIFNLPPTLLLWTYLSRRIRAVGPLILVFVLVSLWGSDVIVAIAGSDDRYLRAIISVTDIVGLGATGTFVALLVSGFLLFSVLGWGALVWIGRSYQSKRMSDESVTVDAVWILFSVLSAINLVFDHPLWALAGPAAFAVYKVCLRIGLSLLARSEMQGGSSPRLLVLRSFSIGGDSERLFDVIGRHWLRVGSIQMIAGIDLLSRTVEPHEFLEFVSGKLSRRFIDSEESLDRRLRERDVAPDRDLRYRVNEFFCYDDTWKMVLTRLAQESDAVLMDLRGLSRDNAGCVFELHELSRVVPLERVVFITDRRTDATLLAQALGGGRAGVFHFAGIRRMELRQLMRALAAAATPVTRMAA
jgi:hypothetical protein